MRHSKKRIMTEKLSILAMGQLLIIEGVYHIHISETVEGTILTGLGIALLYLRERWKFNRWET